MEQQAQGSNRRRGVRLTKDERAELDQQIKEEEERMRREVLSPTYKRLTEKQRELHKIMHSRKNAARQKAIRAEKKEQKRQASGQGLKEGENKTKKRTEGAQSRQTSGQDEGQSTAIAFMQNARQMVYRIAPEEQPAEDGDDGQKLDEGHGGEETQETEKRDGSSMDIGFILN